MITFKQYLLLEGRAHSIASLDGDPFHVFENPNKEQVRSLHRLTVKRRGEGYDSRIRTIKSGDDHFAWDSHYADHKHVVSQLGIDDSHHDHGWIPTKHFPTHDFDLPSVHSKFSDAGLGASKETASDEESRHHDGGDYIDNLLNRFKNKHSEERHIDNQF